MNYIIINGVKSTDINGLIIQSLPNISKPEMRVDTQTADGRDGDFSTPLGYASYDKSLTIGLYGKYNIDEIIEYFSQSGEVVFSNEKDKKYLFAIYAQIDFERLIRFKTATVILHVQPFKYPVYEFPITVLSESGIAERSAEVFNAGNIYSRPTITLTGKGSGEIYINGKQILTVNLGSARRKITINSAECEAYYGDTLLNRLVSGDYNSFVLEKGENTVKITGEITQTVITNYTRWL